MFSFGLFYFKMLPDYCIFCKLLIIKINGCCFFATAFILYTCKRCQSNTYIPHPPNGQNHLYSLKLKTQNTIKLIFVSGLLLSVAWSIFSYFYLSWHLLNKHQIYTSNSTPFKHTFKWTSYIHTCNTTAQINIHPINWQPI